MRRSIIKDAMTGAMAFSLFACATTEPKQQVAAAPQLPEESEPARSTPWSACLERYTTTGTPTVDIERIGRLCGTPNGQRQFSSPRMGKQTEADPVARYTLHAGGKGKCYRVFAVGDANVKGIELEIVSSAGERLAFDRILGAVAALPRHEPLCLEKPDIYTVEVSVSHGGGTYALQVWTN